jgi:hypothetical protein
VAEEIFLIFDGSVRLSVALAEEIFLIFDGSVRLSG